MSSVDKTYNTMTELFSVKVSEVQYSNFFFPKVKFYLLSLSLFLHSQIIMFTLTTLV